MDINLLREALDYAPATGGFTWKISTSNRGAVGAAAGYKDPRGYILIKLHGESYYAHRLAWLYVHGMWPQEQLDHVNHIKHDNRIDNLREVTYRENNKNHPLTKRNTSGVTGVHWDAAREKWFAQIYTDSTPIFLGRFETKEEAIHARELAAKTYKFHNNHGK